jgi:hypothetical protein
MYTVRLNGRQTTKFTNTDLFRGKSPVTDADSGYIGVQSHTGRVTFRNVQIMSQAQAAVAAGAQVSKMEEPHEAAQKKAAKKTA